MRVIAALLSGTLALAGCGEAESAQARPAQKGNGGGGAAPPPMPVEVVAARLDTVVDAIDATGQVEAVQAIELRPEVDGRIAQILVAEGSTVAEGAALFKVDDAELRAQVARAEAERDLARQGLERTRALMKEQATTAQEMERAEATARAAQAQLDLLALRLGRTTVRAPFAGIVGRRFVSLGDYVTPQSRLITLQTVDPQRAVIQVPERFADRVARGQKVTLRVAARPGRAYVGTIEFVDPVVQLPGRTIAATVRVPNPRRELQAGMFVEGRLATAVRPRAVVVPEDAVVSLQGTRVAWVVREGKAERREVTIGARTPGFVEVTAGVAAGEQVVVGGAERLSPGAGVKATVVERGSGRTRRG